MQNLQHKFHNKTFYHGVESVLQEENLSGITTQQQALLLLKTNPTAVSSHLDYCLLRKERLLNENLLSLHLKDLWHFSHSHINY